MDAGREPCWWHSDGPDETAGRVGSPAGKQRVTAGFICPEKKILCPWQPPSVLSQNPGRTGPVCICFASLGTHPLIMSLAQITWCALTVQKCIIAVVKIRGSRETFPARYLFPFSIYASVRNLLGPLVANKKEISDFNLTQELWIFAYLFVLPFDKLQYWSLF